MTPPQPHPASAITGLVGAVLALAMSGTGAPAFADSLLEIVQSGRSMGTGYTVRVRCRPGQMPRSRLAEEAGRILARIDGRMSTYRPESEVSRFNRRRGGDWFPVSAETAALVSAAKELCRLSGGGFDVTAGPVVELWGFGPAGSKRLPPAPSQVEAARQRVGSSLLTVRPFPPALGKGAADLEIDLSALAKGHALDALADHLDAMGIEHYLLEIGGEIKARGRSRRGRPWRVGIEVPDETKQAVGAVLVLEGKALATSGGYRQVRRAQGRRYSHIIDPRLGRPVDHDLVMVSVLHDSAMWADGWATALMVLGPEEALAAARRHGLAARLAVREGNTLAVRLTPSFRRWLVRDELARSARPIDTDP